MALALVAAVVGCRPDKPSTADREREARARVTLESRPAEPGADPALEKESRGLTDEQRAAVVARIGEFELTLGDVERQLAAQPAFARARYRAFDKKVEFLNNMVQFELLAMEALRAGYDSDPDVVLAMKRAMIQKFTANDLQKLVRVSEITDTEIETWYSNNRSMFMKPEQVRASHILFEDRETATRSLAELRASIEADPSRSRVIFADFARRLSKDADSVHKNGDLGFFTTDGYLTEGDSELRVDPALAAATFALKGINAVSDVVNTERGFHVLQVTNRRPAVHRTVEDAKRQVTQILLREKQDAARDGYIRSLREKANVEIFEGPLKEIEITRLGPEPEPPSGPIPEAARPAGVLRPPNALKPGLLPPGAHQKKPEAPEGPGSRQDGRMVR